MHVAWCGHSGCISFSPSLTPDGVVLEDVSLSSKFTLNSPDPARTRLGLESLPRVKGEEPLTVHHTQV